MADNTAKDALKSAKVILLIDWASPDIPRTLVNAGFNVFCHSPSGYTMAEVVTEYPKDVDPRNIFAAKNNEHGYLVFRPLQSSPPPVDIVNIYRPEEEHANIISAHALPLKAKCIWLQPSVASATARSLASKHNLLFIEGYDIAELARV